MSQAERILAYLREGYSLTPIDALEMFGCFRLGARIWDLQQAGHVIESELVEVGTPHPLTGKVKHVARYRLVEAGQGVLF